MIIIFIKPHERFAYFMNTGLIIKEATKINLKNERKSIVYEINSNQNIKEIY